MSFCRFNFYNHVKCLRQGPKFVFNCVLLIYSRDIYQLRRSILSIRVVASSLKVLKVTIYPALNQYDLSTLISSFLPCIQIYYLFTLASPCFFSVTMTLYLLSRLTMNHFDYSPIKANNLTLLTQSVHLLLKSTSNSANFLQLITRGAMSVYIHPIFVSLI